MQDRNPCLGRFRCPVTAGFLAAAVFDFPGGDEDGDGALDGGDAAADFQREAFAIDSWIRQYAFVLSDVAEVGRSGQIRFQGFAPDCVALLVRVTVVAAEQG